MLSGNSTRIPLLLVACLMVASTGAAEDNHAQIKEPCGGVNVVFKDGQCRGGCSGTTLIVGADGACAGSNGKHGEDGGDGCRGKTMIVGGNDNCSGGDGGEHGGSGGTGCDEPMLIVGDGNCEGGDGGDG